MMAENQNVDEILVTVPGETELLLLCLDHLRELRRVPNESLRHGVVDDDYLTIACWALSRALFRNNDAFFDPQKQRLLALPPSPRKGSDFPSLREMERELLYVESPALHGGGGEEEEEGKENAADLSSSSAWYTYDDNHGSNGYRFYVNGGLAFNRPPLALGEVVTAGLVGLGARSRLDAERDMMKNPLYEQFLKAVQAKGFFETATENEDPAVEEMGGHLHQVKEYENRYRKVVQKFRHKLCTSTPPVQTADTLSAASADLFRQMRLQSYLSTMDDSHEEEDFGPPELSFLAGLPVPSLYAQNNRRLVQLPVINGTVVSTTGGVNNNSSPFFQSLDSFDADQVSTMQGSVATSILPHPADLEEAEVMKNAGNSHMQKKEYELAADAYTKALQLSPTGPHSHVYYSNRAAALVSMKRFTEAVQDSERSLALKPDYGKAHARLGLAHFLMGNYRPAVEAYTVALKYEPGNTSSKNYLEKAAKRLAESGAEPQPLRSNASFSVISEWDQGNRQRQQQDNTVSNTTAGGGGGGSSVAAAPSVADEKEAEKYKLKGNACMANRDHESAYEAYSRSIQLNPAGPQSHVYFSNRAAALCYLERYADAEQDSLQSLALVPDYGKAHARLGLSRFFLGDYAGAVSAYTMALEMDPDNAASKSYLAKADAKLREQQHLQLHGQQ
jgi:tetratricopeptide (TPR) repeat protein